MLLRFSCQSSWGCCVTGFCCLRVKGFCCFCVKGVCCFVPKTLTQTPQNYLTRKQKTLDTNTVESFDSKTAYAFDGGALPFQLVCGVDAAEHLESLVNAHGSNEEVQVLPFKTTIDKAREAVGALRALKTEAASWPIPCETKPKLQFMNDKITTFDEKFACLQDYVANRCG